LVKEELENEISFYTYAVCTCINKERERKLSIKFTIEKYNKEFPEKPLKYEKNR